MTTAARTIEIRESDLDGILLQLARLAQFERIMIEMGDLDKSHRVKDCIELTRVRQEAPPYVKPDTNDMRPMETIDIPYVLMEVNRVLQASLDKRAVIDIHRVQAAALAFIGILCAETR